ncbi:amino acid adenylation domain-containing protein [Antrihabitans sp. YC3-6]|uniref:Amino acid adenylation domain-containing protein n=1 Tax=Antrihabitans stalagmiti TaxID=2799499 RepID=A0A934NP26_9NOCA|nr:non-ribosomal peptide synthetase [Antrihabitans stalagmiti]MBJ8338734.1 amino acid adenylation domain-containing protein [Antrihabitans stalagmiti]
MRKERVARQGRRREKVAMAPQLISAAVEVDPAATAVVCDTESLTYADLDVTSSRLARVLIARGAGPGDSVAVALPRSVASISALWAVAKSGAAYVPVDPSYPTQRIGFLVADSAASVGITIAAVRPSLPDTVEWFVLDDEHSRRELAEQPSHPVSYSDRIRTLQVAHPAYVIYTSGSTGTPKGVVVTHSGLQNLTDELRTRTGVTAASRVLHFASPSFDASILEWLLVLGAGATMVVAGPNVLGGPDLAELLREERVTHAFLTPAALASLNPAGLDDLAVVVVGGDVCPPALVRSWARPVGSGVVRQFFNAYGPTEGTVACNISAPLVAGAEVSVGGPIHGVRQYVLDAKLRPVPFGAVGELYLAGSGVARGYHMRSALTASRFVADPYGDPGARLYRTGDLVRRDDDGVLSFVARNDAQVKLRGFRIETGEIDAAISTFPAVAMSATIVRQDDSTAAHLASYLIAASNATPNLDELRRYLTERLPSQLIPTTFVLLAEFPLTAAGKIDRAALPDPVRPVCEYRLPSTPTEQVVAEVFADVLGVARVGADDNFFALGGDSLTAVKVVARLGARMGIRILVPTLFDAPTVAGFAAAALAQSAGADLLSDNETRSPSALSIAQQRSWFSNQFDTASAIDDIPLAVSLSGRLDVSALAEAAQAVVERHESLRTYYPTGYDGPYPVVLAAARAFPELEVESVAAPDLLRRFLDLALTGFDIASQVPLRARLFRIEPASDAGAGVAAEPSEYVLGFVAHHIVADELSMRGLTAELAVAYAERAAGPQPTWRPLDLSDTAYAQWNQDPAANLIGNDDLAQHIPLAPAQERMWHDVLGSRNGDWNMKAAFEIVEEIDIEHLEAAVLDVLERHEPLRTRYPSTDYGPAQVVDPMSDVVVDLETVRTSAVALDSAIESFVHRGFDVSIELPLRLRLFEIGPHRTVLVIVLHHISGDALSFGPLLRDMLVAYDSRRNGVAPTWPALPLRYRDYVMDKRAELGDERDANSPAGAALRYWLATLADRPARLDLPTDRPVGTVRCTAGATIPFALDGLLHAQLLDLAEQRGMSLFMILQAAFALVVGAFGESADVTVATSLAGRSDERLDGLVGNFSDDVLMRIRFEDADSLAEYLREVREVVFGAFAHPDTSNPRLLRALREHGASASEPLFRATLILHTIVADVHVVDGVVGLASYPIAAVRAKHDLEFAIRDHYTADRRPAGVEGALIYPTAVFDAETVARVVSRFTVLLERIAAGFHGTVGDLLRSFSASGRDDRLSTVRDRLRTA